MEPIAVIGLGCRFPGAANVRALWDLLRSGRDALRNVPEGRYLELSKPGFGQSDLGKKLAVSRGGFLEGIDLFDAAAFHISPREARVIDPQQRLLLETTWEALEDAGQDMLRLAGSPVGVYVGVWGSDYQARLFRKSPEIDIAMTTGGGRYAAAGRLSYAFDFQGPSLTIDTACSSSLVAIHLGCQALRTGECNLAIVGGANVILDSSVTLGYMAAGALSPDGRCKFGDATANGYVRSEGVGIAILKTLRSALADKDPIHAIIRGSAVTHNGQTGGSLLAPGEDGQVRLLRQVLKEAGLNAGDLDYVEAHGTGTQVGDRMELRALGKVLHEGRNPDSMPCLIGSIKTNIGHTESAAGIAGFIKAILCLKHREIPPTLNFRQPNPEIPWNELPLQIVTERTKLRPRGRPAIAGVNSFGITGTFAHVLLEEAPRRKTGAGAAALAPVLLPISARSRASLMQLAGAFAEQIRSSPSQWENIAFSAGLRRTHHEWRAAIVGRDSQTMADGLEALSRDEMAASLFTATEASVSEPRAGWVFSGQGPQWAGMGRQLFESEPVFRSMMERLEALVEPLMGWSLLEKLNALGAASELETTAVAQPAIFSIQIALAELLKSWGLRPSMVVGHSVGEAAAACVAGVLSLEDAVRVICARARIAEKASGLGKMAAVELTIEEAEKLISSLGGALSLAAVNGPRSLTISGAVEPLGKFCEAVAERGRFCRVLDVNYPFHSALLDPLLDEMSEIGKNISPRSPHTPLYSTVHGRLATASDFTSAYWPRNLRDTVRFVPAIEQMAAAGCNLFVEISPHPVLSYSINQVLQSINATASVVGTLRRDGDEAADLRRAVGEQYVLGCNPDWRTLVPPDAGEVSLPSYCWQRESYWIDESQNDPATGSLSAATGDALDPLLHRSFKAMGSSGASSWETEISFEKFPWLAEHCVQGRPVFPAAAYLLPALKAANQLLPGAVLTSIEIHEALFVAPTKTLGMQFTFMPAEDGSFGLSIYAGDPARPEMAHKHLSARVISPGKTERTPSFRPADFVENGEPALSRDAVYAAMRRGRLDYGESFRSIDVIRRGNNEALARLALPTAIQAEMESYGIHPATFDACIQTLVSLAPDWLGAGDLWMPAGASEVVLRKTPAPSTPLWAWATVETPAHPASGEVIGNVHLLDDDGEVFLSARGVRLKKVSGDGDLNQWLHEVRWRPLPLPNASPADGFGAIASVADLEKGMLEIRSSIEEDEAIRATLAEVNRIGGLNVQRSITELGIPLALGRRFTMDEVMTEGRIAPLHRKLVRRLLKVLCEGGVLCSEGGGWRVEKAPSREDIEPALTAARSADDGFAPLWQIFSRACRNLTGVLTGQVDAVEVLFGGGGAEALERLYSSHPVWALSLRQAAHAVSAMAERLPAGRTLRMLEIGGGTGGLTSHLAPLLPADRTEYVFTDLSSYFLSRAREKFAAYPFLTAMILDIESDPGSQGFSAGSFDLIVAANCLHATRDIRQSLAHVRQLLAPGGFLLLQEETAAERWTDLIFGLTEGWWRFEDTDLRPEHPLLSPSTWLNTLEEAGFADTVVVGGKGGDACGSAVILCRQPKSQTKEKASSNRGRWLILADEQGAARMLGQHLEDLGQNYLIVDPASPEAPLAVTEWLEANDTAARTLVDLRPLDAILVETCDAAQLAAIEKRAFTGFLDTTHRLADYEGGHPPRLAVVTRGSQATGVEQALSSPAQASLWTAARVAALEHPRLSIVRIDLESGPLDLQVTALAEELLRGDGEPEIALRNGSRLAPRLVCTDAPDSDQLPIPEDQPFALTITHRGALDGIEAQPITRQSPAAGEVEIRVAAAGMNFRDVLNILGAVDSVPLGLECSGVVTGLGDGVRDFAVGDEVMAAGLGSWRTYFKTPAALVARKPHHLTHEQAAALPIAYLTAHYALRHLARIQPGQCVLIHSAAGGVGLAAVHLALAAGTEVFGTAGSPEKRDYLLSLGVRHVFDSRTLQFAEQIRAVGGVLDVVLNCFTGDFIPASLDLLVKGGCFVEIGKRDIWTHPQMTERRPDVQYHVVELAEVMRNAPHTLQPMLRQVAEEVIAGRLPPLPIRVFPSSHVLSALRHMQHGRHTGKIALKFPTWIPGELAKGSSDFKIGSWLITGGFGGLGLALAEWLAERGAREIILAGRRAPEKPASVVIDRLKSRGARVLVEICDAANEEELSATLKRGARELSPLRGVFHLAGVLDDAPLRQLDWPRFEKVFAPKVAGAWNLHRLTREMNLDCFVLFSSWTALLGSSGQANHAAANAFLDSLAHNRRAQGLPAQTINWGGWRDIGSAALPERLAHLSRQGIGNISPEEGLEALARIMKTDAIQIGVSPFDAAKWRSAAVTDANGRFTSELTFEPDPTEEEDTSEAPLPLREALQKALPGMPRRQVLESCVQRHLARVLRMSPAKFDVRKTFKNLGLDSLTSLELRNLLEIEAGLKLPASLVYNHATIATLATELAAQLGVSLDANLGAVIEEPPATEIQMDDEVAALLSALQDLPPEEALRLLRADSSQGGGL